MFNGICDTGTTYYNWIAPIAESADQCGVKCSYTNGCTAYSYTRSPSDWNWKYKDQLTNCLLRATMCDPAELRRSDAAETYEIVADLSGQVAIYTTKY